MTTLKYIDSSHRYYLDGKRCKSVTTIAGRLEDGYRLDLWKQRQVAIGIASHPALIERIAAHFDDKDALNDIVEDAHTHAKTHQAADRGTAMHRFTERADNNEAILATDLSTATITAWRTALDEAGLDVIDGWTETIVAYPEQGVCGRMDRLVRRRTDGRIFVLDLKTGAKALTYPHKIAIQLALYVNAPMAFVLDGASGESSSPLQLPDIDKDVALVFAMPTPDDWSIVPVRIDEAWNVARKALWTALAWQKADDLVLPPIVQSAPPVPEPCAPVVDLFVSSPESHPIAEDPFAGLHGNAMPQCDAALAGNGHCTHTEPECAAALGVDDHTSFCCHCKQPLVAHQDPQPDVRATVDAATPAGITAPAGESAEAPPYTTREWVVERVRALAKLHPEALDTLAGVWPPGVPGLASKALLSPDQWRLVDDAVAKVEKAIEAPFIPGPRNHEADGWAAKLADTQQARAAAAVLASVDPVAPDEPADAEDHLVDAACMLLNQLGTGQPALWAQRLLIEARDAGVPIAIRRVRSRRLCAVGFAVAAWARINDDRLTRLGCALLPDATFIDDRPLGVIFATLDETQAHTLREIAEGVHDGTWQYRCDDQGGERFVQKTNA